MALNSFLTTFWAVVINVLQFYVFYLYKVIMGNFLEIMQLRCCHGPVKGQGLIHKDRQKLGKIGRLK